MLRFSHQRGAPCSGGASNSLVNCIMLPATALLDANSPPLGVRHELRLLESLGELLRQDDVPAGSVGEGSGGQCVSTVTAERAACEGTPEYTMLTCTRIDHPYTFRCTGAERGGEGYGMSRA